MSRITWRFSLTQLYGVQHGYRGQVSMMCTVIYRDENRDPEVENPKNIVVK